MGVRESIAGIATPSSVERARRLVLEHGWNATCYQIINPGIDHWFDPTGDAVVGYVTRHRVRVVAGAPVCAAARLAEVVGAFEADARRSRERVCYFGAEARLEALTHGDPRYGRLILGAQPVVDPREWSAILAGRASLRAQLNRARNKSVHVEEWDPERARSDDRVAAVLGQWLRGRGLPPLHFLVEPETLDRLFDRRIFVAQRAEAIVGFSVCSPIPRRNGWLVEQIVRSLDAPNGTTELLVDAVARAAASGGATYLTLGLSPLSRRVVDPDPPAAWLRLLLAWVREHGRRFYNFDGLDRFKAKFTPSAWESVYAIANEPRVSPRTLLAIATAFSGGSPFLLVARGVVDALTRGRRS